MTEDQVRYNRGYDTGYAWAARGFRVPLRTREHAENNLPYSSGYVDGWTEWHRLNPNAPEAA